MDNDFLPYHERNSFAFIKLYDLINNLIYLLLFIFSFYFYVYVYFYSSFYLAF